MPHLDGPGQAKYHTLEDARTQLQRVNSIVERMATAARSQSDTGAHRHAIQRAASPIVGLLKPQFENLADQVSQLILITTRGGGDNVKVRAMRETVAQIRTQLEIAITKVKEHHAVEKRE